MNDALRGGAETLPAGRVLDALVAERLMGWEITNRGRRVRPPDRREPSGISGYADARNWIAQVCPEFSTDIAAAWTVVERVGLLDSHRGSGLDSGLTLQRNESNEWEVRYRAGLAIARADTAPLAICRAALAAITAEPLSPE